MARVGVEVGEILRPELLVGGLVAEDIGVGLVAEAVHLAMINRGFGVPQVVSEIVPQVVRFGDQWPDRDVAADLDSGGRGAVGAGEASEDIVEGAVLFEYEHDVLDRARRRLSRLPARSPGQREVPCAEGPNARRGWAAPTKRQRGDDRHRTGLARTVSPLRHKAGDGGRKSMCTTFV